MRILDLKGGPLDGHAITIPGRDDAPIHMFQWINVPIIDAHGRIIQCRHDGATGQWIETKEPDPDLHDRPQLGECREEDGYEWMSDYDEGFAAGFAAALEERA